LKEGYPGQPDLSPKIMNSIRKSNFKIGCFHGKINPVSDSEARIRNDIYLTGMVEIEISRKEAIPIRIIGYEIPLEEKASRNQCIDLLGYDHNFKPYIIELKKPKSTEKIDEVTTQIHRYENLFEKTRDNIERETRKKFLWKEFRFSPGLGKIILSSRDFFNRITSVPSFKDSGVFLCSFSRLQSNFDNLKILEKCGSKGVVKLKIENR
jgi:hypothetical protein